MVMSAQKVTRAAHRAQMERLRLEQAIREYHAEGASLRTIAKLAGLSHQTIRRIVS